MKKKEEEEGKMEGKVSEKGIKGFRGQIASLMRFFTSVSFIKEPLLVISHKTTLEEIFLLYLKLKIDFSLWMRSCLMIILLPKLS